MGNLCVGILEGMFGNGEGYDDGVDTLGASFEKSSLASDKGREMGRLAFCGWVGWGGREREREFGEEWGPTFGREGKIITRHPCLKKIVVPKCIPMSKIYKKPELVSYGKSGIILPFEAMTIENVYIKIFLKLSYLSFA